MPGIAVYSATKHAVKGLTEALAVEFKAIGVRAADVLPGLIDTPILPPGVAANAPKDGMFRAIPPIEVAKVVARHISRQTALVCPRRNLRARQSRHLAPEQTRDNMANGTLFAQLTAAEIS
jgi:NAD(P)-dependent dehydrogenase (short-subunit alcohol dehydrogenase family)